MSNIFNSAEKEFWFHVSNQNEIPIFGELDKSIDINQLYSIVSGLNSNATKEESREYLYKLILHNSSCIDTLRTLVGVTDKRMYLELSYIFNKACVNINRDNVLGESAYILKKHSVAFFETLISKRKRNYKEALNIIIRYLEGKGIFFILNALNKLTEEEIDSIVSYFLLPKEIQQEETKRRGHGAEQALALVLHNLGVEVCPENRYINPMSADDPNVLKTDFDSIVPRNEATTWSIDLIIKEGGYNKVFIQSLIHSSDPGQYGVNKSGETVTIKKGLTDFNISHNDNKELWGMVDGVGFIENPNNTVFKMINHFDNFVQLKSLYKAGLRLHKLGIVKIKAIKFDMDFYTAEEANEMFEKYGSRDIIKILSGPTPEGLGEPIEAGKAWLYI